MPDLSRRAFLKKGVDKALKTAVKVADKHATKIAINWIRPPYALDELEFNLACTRCNGCIDACEYDVLFKLSANYGPTQVKTPVMDLKNKSCHLCEDWPCVTACEPRALKLPVQLLAEGEESDPDWQPKLPKLAIAKISPDECLPFRGPECGACRTACKVEGALQWDLTKPVINEENCVGCGLCRDYCITNPKSITIHHIPLDNLNA